MMTIGLNMLGNMNKAATSQESLSMPFWRLLVASGILCIVIGFFNIVAVSPLTTLTFTAIETNTTTELRLPRHITPHHGPQRTLPRRHDALRSRQRIPIQHRPQAQSLHHLHPPHRQHLLPQQHQRPHTSHAHGHSPRRLRLPTSPITHIPHRTYQQPQPPLAIPIQPLQRDPQRAPVLPAQLPQYLAQQIFMAHAPPRIINLLAHHIG
jgi:hypothetical protein